MASSDTRRRVSFWLRAAVSLALIVVLAWRVRSEAGGVALESGPWLLVALALLPLAVGIRVASFMLLVNRDGRVVSFAQATYLTLVGAGAGLFLPGGAGDLFKAAHGARAYGSVERVVASSLVDKLTSLAAVAAMGVIGSLLAAEPGFAALSALVLAVAAVPLAAPEIVPWRLVVRVLGGRDASPGQLSAAVRTPYRVLAPVLAVSFVGWLATYTIVLACCRAAGTSVDAGYVYSMAPLITLTGLIPISLAGLGLSQVTMSWLLVSEGVPPSVAISAAFFQLVVNITPGIVGIALYTLSGGARRR